VEPNTTNFNQALSAGKTLTHRQLLFCPETLAFEAPGLLDAVTKGFSETGFKSRWMGILMKRCLFLALIAMGVLIPASAQTTVFNCSSWANTGTCGANTSYIGQAFGFNGNGPPTVSGTQILLMPTGATHQADNLQYNAAKVNDQAFTSTFTFVPNGWNLAFVLQNNTNGNSAGLGIYFGAGAGCEASFYQAFSGAPPNNIFALELDSQSYIDSSETFPYSTVQIYHQDQSPCNPNDNQPNYTLTDKTSTYPVPLTSPANSLGSTTSDTYSATISYNGTNVVLNLYDITAGGSCPGSKCFTYTWSDVNIPSLVNGTTAYVGLSTGTNEASNHPLYIDSFSYTEGSATQAASPGSTTKVVTAPTISPAAGTYSGAQSITLSDATSGATIYYTTNGTTPTTSSTKYTGPITVSSTETLQAIAAATGDTNSPAASAAYTISSPNPDPENAPVINYPSGFADHPSQLWLGNGSVYSGSAMELTNSSANLAHNAWYKTPVNVQAFTTSFTWNATCPAKPARCGDGMGFMIISNSNPSSAGFNYSGYAGSQFSWSRCTSSTDCPSIKSALVKFDLFDNSTGTDGANLTGFYSGGEFPQPPQAESNMAPSGINMESGHLMKATLTYNGTVLMETVTDTATGATYRNSYSVNIPALVGGDTGLVGFGASSGEASVTQNIQSWTFTVESPVN